MGKRRAGPSTGSRSIAGQWIVATVLDRWELRDRLVGQLRGPLRGDELAVLRESARLALRSHFGDGYDVRSVTAFAVGVQESWGLPSGAGVMELEAAMRAALGEPDVDLSGIKVATLMEAYFFSVMRVARLREWDERALRNLVARAEAAAVKQGWKPQRAN